MPVVAPLWSEPLDITLVVVNLTSATVSYEIPRRLSSGLAHSRSPAVVVDPLPSGTCRGSGFKHEQFAGNQQAAQTPAPPWRGTDQLSAVPVPRKFACETAELMELNRAIR